MRGLQRDGIHLGSRGAGSGMGTRRVSQRRSPCGRTGLLGRGSEAAVACLVRVRGPRRKLAPCGSPGFRRSDRPPRNRVEFRCGYRGLHRHQVGVYKISLVSFPIYFQCKRYAGSVGPNVVRDFCGAMTGRGEKGLIITTGAFTPAARAEATRDGAPPVDLVDGDEFCDLIVDHRLGVEVTERLVKDVVVDESFFATV